MNNREVDIVLERKPIVSMPAEVSYSFPGLIEPGVGDGVGFY